LIECGTDVSVPRTSSVFWGQKESCGLNPEGIQFNSRGQAFRAAPGSTAKNPDPERVARSQRKYDPFRVRKQFVIHSPWVSLRSPTAIKLHPFGIQHSPTLPSYGVLIEITHAVGLGPHTHFSRNSFSERVIQQMFSIK